MILFKSFSPSLLPLTHFNPIAVYQTGSLIHTASGGPLRFRGHKRISNNVDIERDRFKYNVRYGPNRTRVEMKSPLMATEHPVDNFAKFEDDILQQVKEASVGDLPDPTMEDPYAEVKVDKRCLLCPKRYAIPIIPDYKNPKLLAQFVSPLTGMVYKKNITGLCEKMQRKLELEINKSKNFGFMSTEAKEMHQLHDPKLFDPAKPKRPNPF